MTVEICLLAPAASLRSTPPEDSIWALQEHSAREHADSKMLSAVIQHVGDWRLTWRSSAACVCYHRAVHCQGMSIVQRVVQLSSAPGLVHF